MSDSNAAAAPGPNAPTEGRREVRLALVLYGGVSMAIYMYGVAYEIWRAVRAGRALDRGEPEANNPWTEVLQALRTRVAVDIVSGASAGGINGILLGRALACGADLDAARDIWLEKADFNVMLDSDEKKPQSLLDSGFFEDELAAAFEQMGAKPGGRLVDVLDVFVSTTSLSGDPRTFEDGIGHSLATRRHDVPVRLRYRDPERYAMAIDAPPEDEPGEGARNDFDRTGLLVQLSRATSAFPAAFSPVERKAGQHEFAEWPEGRYTDGGVTDNKPFEQALDAIFGRAAERPVSRWLLSVNPDPQDAAEAQDIEPDFLDVVAAATFAIPRYESIQADLDRLYDHQKRVRIFWDGALEGLERSIADGCAGGISGSAYDGLRRAALVNYIVEELHRARRYSAATKRSTWIDDSLRISDQLPKTESDWKALDVAFELRRAYYAIKLLGRTAAEPGGGELIAARQRMWARFEAARSAAKEAVAALPAGGELNLDALIDGMESLADMPGVLDGQARAAFDAYEERDRALLAVDPFGYRTPRDSVNHAQVDPSAAHELDPWVPAEQRLAGDTLGHFGGFLERRWRENDMLWGRLDATDVLVRVLAAEDEAAEPSSLTAAVHEEIVRKTLKLDPGSDDWREALSRSNAAGEENVSDVPGQRLALLAARAAGVAQKMFKSLSTDRRSGGTALVRVALKALGSGAIRLFTPLLAMLALAVGKGGIWVRAAAIAALIPATAATLYVVAKAVVADLDLAVLAGGWAASIAGGYALQRRVSKDG